MGMICRNSNLEKNNVVLVLVLFALGLILFFGFIFVYAAEDWWGNGVMRDNGAIGDYFNGMLGPFIALTGVITTFAAFFVQFQANQDQREAIRKQQEELEKQQQFLASQLANSIEANQLQVEANLQQKHALQKQQEQLDHQLAQQRIDRFEQRFFEMLRIHRENAEGMKFVGMPFESYQTNGNVRWGGSREYRHHEVVAAINVEFEAVFKLLEILRNSGLISDVSPFERANLAYGLVFAGLTTETKDLRIPIISEDKIENVKDAFDFLTQRKTRDPESDWAREMAVGSYIWGKDPNAREAPKMLQGYSTQLSAYYRHLFQMVDQLEKFEADGFTDDDRKRYAKLLRAQFTDEDQLLFYYNSLWQGVGDDWWECGFITKYQLIKQVPIARIPNEISPVKRLGGYLKTTELTVIQEHLDSTIYQEMLD